MCRRTECRRCGQVTRVVTVFPSLRGPLVRSQRRDPNDWQDFAGDLNPDSVSRRFLERDTGNTREST
jgi:hypothetical protein